MCILEIDGYLHDPPLSSSLIFSLGNVCIMMHIRFEDDGYSMPLFGIYNIIHKHALSPHPSSLSVFEGGGHETLFPLWFGPMFSR